jgi:hypothetical protein
MKMLTGQTAAKSKVGTTSLALTLALARRLVVTEAAASVARGVLTEFAPRPQLRSRVVLTGNFCPLPQAPKYLLLRWL